MTPCSPLSTFAQRLSLLVHVFVLLLNVYIPASFPQRITIPPSPYSIVTHSAHELRMVLTSHLCLPLHPGLAGCRDDPITGVMSVRGLQTLVRETGLRTETWPNRKESPLLPAKYQLTAEPSVASSLAVRGLRE